MENQELNNLEILPPYLEKRFENVPIVPLQTDSIISQELTFSDIVNFYIENFPQDILNEAFEETQNMMELYADTNPESFIYEEGSAEDWFDEEIYVNQDQWLGQVHPVFTGFVELKSNQFNYEIPTTDGDVIYNGITPIKEELGKGIGDCDLTNIKYYTEPKSIWEMFGFENVDLQQISTPNNPRYWKNIIPQGYSIFDRQGVESEPVVSINTTSNQGWNGINEKFGYNYYYPVLPKHGTNGRYTDELPRHQSNIALTTRTGRQNLNFAKLPIKIVLIKKEDNVYDVCYESINDSFRGLSFGGSGAWGQYFPLLDGGADNTSTNGDGDPSKSTNPIQFSGRETSPVPVGGGQYEPIEVIFPLNQITNVQRGATVVPLMINRNGHSGWDEQIFIFDPYNIVDSSQFIIDSDYFNIFGGQVMEPETLITEVQGIGNETVWTDIPNSVKSFFQYPSIDGGSDKFEQTPEKVFHRMFTLDFTNSILTQDTPSFYHKIIGLGQLPEWEGESYHPHGHGESYLEVSVLANQESIEAFVTSMGYNLGVDVTIDMVRTIRAARPLEITYQGGGDYNYAPYAYWRPEFNQMWVVWSSDVPNWVGDGSSQTEDWAIVIDKIYLNPVDFSTFTENDIINNIEYVIENSLTPHEAGVNDNLFFKELALADGRKFHEGAKIENNVDENGDTGNPGTGLAGQDFMNGISYYTSAGSNIIPAYIKHGLVVLSKATPFTPFEFPLPFVDNGSNVNPGEPPDLNYHIDGGDEFSTYYSLGDFLGVVKIEDVTDYGDGKYYLDYDAIGIYDERYIPYLDEEEDTEEDDDLVDDDDTEEDDDLFDNDDEDNYDEEEDPIDDDVDIQRPFPDTMPIFFEGSEEGLVVNIINEKIETDVFNDISGNKNYGFAIKDFNPQFDEKTLRVKKSKERNTMDTSKQNGAF